MNSMVYKQELVVLAPISKVWDALIDPEQTPKYMFGCEVVSDWTPGSPVLWRSGGIVHVKGNVVTFEPCKELAFTVFDPNAGYIDDPANYLTTRYVLTEEAEGTRIVVTQGDFANVENGEKRFAEAPFGWEMTLNSFKRMLED